MRNRSPLDRLASPRLAAGLIGVFLAACLMSFVIPQRNRPDLTLYDQWSAENPAIAQIARTLGLDDVFASPAMIATYALLAVNLSLCTYGRWARFRRRRIVLSSAPPRARSVAVADAQTAQHLVSRSLVAVPRHWKLSAASDGSNGVVADGGVLGFVGSVVMHAALITLLGAGVVSALTRFEGEMALTQGQQLRDSADSYLSLSKEPVIGTAFRDGSVGLESLQFEYEEGQITSVDALLRFTDESGSDIQTARINEPARWQQKSFLLYAGGHAVPLRVVDRSGSTVLEGVVRLGDRIPGGYVDEIALPDSRRLRIETLADASDAERADSEVMALRDPRVAVVLSGEGASSGPLQSGESVDLGDLQVSVGSVVLWTKLLVRADRGIPVAYVSFALIIVGVLVRLVFPDRSVAVLVNEHQDGAATIYIWGKRRSSAEDRVVERLEVFMAEQESK